VLIAAPASGQGKTTVTAALARLHRNLGRKVRVFKCGPDFLDPMILERASGAPVYQLDLWMIGAEESRRLLWEAAGEADLILIEGVMGLFDGTPSSADLARHFGVPVLAVIDGTAMAQTFGALALGLARYQADLPFAGVLANRVGSLRHAQLLEGSLTEGLRWYGGLSRERGIELPSRHLGLVTADHAGLTAAVFEQLADVCDQHLEMARLVELARSARPLQVESPGDCPDFRGDCPDFRGARRENGTVPLQPTMSQSPRRVRLGIARDAAFHFYYPDNLEMLARCGAELAFFSPLGDRRLPDGLDGLYFGGGYPEAHAESLAANAGMCAEVRRFASAGGWVYAECGGLMYLGRSLTTLDRRHHAMAGVLPVDTAMLDRLKMLGYAEVALAADSLWGPAGRVCRGHDFHYSEIVGSPPADLGWTQVYRVRRGDRAPAESEGFQNGRVLASYVHLHFASRPELAAHFVTTCGNRR